MYGNKQQKTDRLGRLVALVAKAGKGISQAALAQRLGVSRAVINKDLVTLHVRGVRLAEDDKGRLSLPE